MLAALPNEANGVVRSKWERVAPTENDPRRALAEKMLAQAARHLHGIPINGERYSELLDGVRVSVFDDSKPFTDYEALHSVRALEDRFVQTAYGIRNKTLLEAQRTQADRHAHALKRTIDTIPETVVRADLVTGKYVNVLARAFVRGINDLNLADACLAGGDLSRATSYVKSALKSVSEASTGKTRLEERLERLAERPDAIGESAQEMREPISQIGIHLSFVRNRSMDLLDRITDAGRQHASD